jgi:enoyl-CoA hydratase|tara:strand:+ start:5651 stop:6421 length:771 start_codon:yes stop_codon:yes gene_type:complete
MSPTQEGEVPELRIANGRARILLRRPEKRNRLEPVDLAQVIDHINVIENDESVRIVTIEAEGPSWCSGYHLGALATAERPKVSFGEACDAVMSITVPTVAVLKGNIHGGGTDLAMACDLRLGKTGLVLQMPAAKIGLQYYASGLERFVSRIGPAATKRIFLTGEPIQADELLRVGYLTEMLPEEALEARVIELCNSVAELSPSAVALTKRAIENLSSDKPSVDEVQEGHIWSTRSPDHQEAMKALVERRSPQFPAT